MNKLYKVKFRQAQVYHITAVVLADSKEEALQKVNDGEFYDWTEDFDGVEKEENYSFEVIEECSKGHRYICGTCGYFISEDDFETECCPECGGSGYIEEYEDETK
jgi:rubrerythrin